MNSHHIFENYSSKLVQTTSQLSVVICTASVVVFILTELQLYIASPCCQQQRTPPRGHTILVSIPIPVTSRKNQGKHHSASNITRPQCVMVSQLVNQIFFTLCILPFISADKQLYRSRFFSINQAFITFNLITCPLRSAYDIRHF